MESHPTAWSGTIVGRRARIGLRFKAPLDTPPELLFSVLSGEGSDVAITASRTRLLADNTGAIYGVTLPDGFVRSVRTHLAVAGGGLGPELGYGADYEILDLMPASVNGLLPITFMRKNRIRHAGTLQFMVEQVSTSPEYGHFVQIEAVKVLAYLAIEDGEPKTIDAALRLLDAQFARLEGLPTAKGSSKEHPRHILISLRFIRILGALMNGQPKEALEDMGALQEHVSEVVAAPITAYNLGLALLLHAWILARGGKTAEALRVAEAIIGIFRAASATMPSAKSKIFAELGMTLQSATVAIDIISGLMGRQALDWDGTLSSVTMARRFSRLTTNEAIERFGRRLEEAAALVALQQGESELLAG